MYGPAITVLAGSTQGEPAEILTDPVLEESGDQENSVQAEETIIDIPDPATTYQATENAGDISGAETHEIEINSSGTSEITQGSLIKDVVLVLDNSGSMKKNDPQFLTNNAVTEFINNLDESTRIAIVIFDEDVRTAVPLTDISSTSKQGLLDSLSQINYRGLYTNSPAAVESAIYNLKNNGREEARKIIVFMTDGIVDTGNADRDLEKTKWLKEDLAADAADADIRIFGIAFTDNADFELIQSLAQKTEGEYYRALLADDLQDVFSKLNTLINKPDEPEIVEKVETRIVEKIIEKVIEPKQEPVIVRVPVSTTQIPDESERRRSTLILFALVVLILAVIAVVLMLLRGSKSKSRDEETAQEAYLNDIHGITTNQASFALGNKPTMLGRVAGKDTEYLNYFVIPETTIGRRHALIEYKDFSYWIADQGSINGTFVNNRAVTSEVRLKHGDIIRLHKVEFEFVIPEMADSGMTVVSKTVISDADADADADGNEATLMPGGTDLPEPDFDISGSADSINAEDDEETIMRGDVPSAEVSDGSQKADVSNDNAVDEDIMSGYDDDDATIRP